MNIQPKLQERKPKKMTEIAINGIGRDGRLALRALIEGGFAREIVLVNNGVDIPELHAISWNLIQFMAVGMLISNMMTKAVPLMATAFPLPSKNGKACR